MFFLDVFLKGLKPQYDDDSIDRLNYYFTPMILVMFSLTLSAKQYVGQPIQCWIPAQFTGAWEQYSENYCFVQNTYFVSPEKHIPDGVQEREDQQIGYYQWVPFVLGLQAVLFYSPALLWRLLNFLSGFTMKPIVRMARDTNNVSHDNRKKAVDTVSSYLIDSLRMQELLRRAGGIKSFFYSGKYVATLYVFTKLLYVLQVFGQFFLMNRFLSTEYTFWGFGILRDILSGREWEESGHFPRVSMCDFDVRVLGNKHRHSVQCVLMINMFNEKVYIFLWWWCLGVLAITLVNLVQWAIKLLSASKRKAFISMFLRASESIDTEDVSSARVLDRFVEGNLKPDGVLLIHLISRNAGDVLTTELVTNLWGRFLENLEVQQPKPTIQGPMDDFKERLA